MVAFRKNVNIYAAPAIAGDIVSDNPVTRDLLTALAATNGVLIGTFSWNSVNPTNGVYEANKTGIGIPTGIVKRVQVCTSTDIKSGASMVIMQGFLYQPWLKATLP